MKSQAGNNSKVQAGRSIFEFTRAKKHRGIWLLKSILRVRVPTEGADPAGNRAAAHKAVPEVVSLVCPPRQASVAGLVPVAKNVASEGHLANRHTCMSPRNSAPRKQKDLEERQPPLCLFAPRQIDTASAALLHSFGVQ